MLKPVFLTLPILALILIACATPAPVPTATAIPTATPDIPATVDARVAAVPTQTAYPTTTPYPTGTPRPTYTLYPTGTPWPTYTLYPTPTALPTATPYPTYTPFPTATPYPTLTPWPTATVPPTATPRPTNTPLPTPTATPYPTATPKPTSTPRPATKWELPYQPINITQARSVKTRPFILYACSVGIKGPNNSPGYGETIGFTFTEDGKSENYSHYARVVGFRKNANIKTGSCYDMAVKYQGSAEICYYKPRGHWRGPLIGTCDGGWVQETPLFRLTGSRNFSQRP